MTTHSNGPSALIHMHSDPYMWKTPLTVFVIDGHYSHTEQCLPTEVQASGAAMATQ